MNDTIADIVLVEILMREAKCEARHGRGTVPVECSIEATHRYRVECVGIDKLVCQIIGSHVAVQIAKRGKCAECMRPLADHWSVTPA